MNLLTTKEVAARHNCTPTTITVLAGQRGIKPARIIGKAWMWTPTQAARLKPGPRGRPRTRRGKNGKG